jgi:hypothetical protein
MMTLRSTIRHHYHNWGTLPAPLETYIHRNRREVVVSGKSVKICVESSHFFSSGFFLVVPSLLNWWDTDNLTKVLS